MDEQTVAAASTMTVDSLSYCKFESGWSGGVKAGGDRPHDCADHLSGGYQTSPSVVAMVGLMPFAADNDDNNKVII